MIHDAHYVSQKNLCLLQIPHVYGKCGQAQCNFLPARHKCTAAQVGSFSTQFCQKRRPLDHSIICCIHLMCDVIFFCATGCPTCASLLRQEWLYLSMINASAAQRSGIEDCAYFHTDLWKQWKFEACLKLVVLSPRSSYVFLTLREAHTAMWQRRDVY